MNTLASIKSKLMVKPDINQREKIAVFIKEPVTILENIKIKSLEEEKSEEEKSEEPVKKPMEKQIKLIDDRDKGYDIGNLMKRLEKSNILLVKHKLDIPKIEEVTVKPLVTPELPSSKKAKKVVKKPLLIEEDELEMEKDDELDKEKEKDDELEIKLPSDKNERKTKRVQKGIAILGPEVIVDIGDTPINIRLPKKSPLVNIKVSSYYMNNREIFVNFINSIFEPYRRELQSNTESISCDTIGKDSDNVSLLTHQKIVRDYMNLYTPYRGLLLYHGLGSGKTCSSIAIAEGMKNSKRVIILTPKSLRENYISELKKCGDLIYKKNQFWEWISLELYPEALEPMSAILNLPQDYITKKRGAWFVNVSKKSNFADLSTVDKNSLDDQLNKMIESKYTFINYNGLRLKQLETLTNGFTRNLFDDRVVVIDEAHNLISRIVNKVKKEKDIRENDRGEKDHAPVNLAMKLYEYLLSAQNARIVLLTGTPIINYPNEFAILFNILRGYIKTWEFPLDVKTSKKIDKQSLQEILMGEKSLDYLDYSPSSKLLTITRNPFGFKNKIKKESGYIGVSNTKKSDVGESELDTDSISDIDFERKIISILKKNDIDVITSAIKIRNKKSLPDKLDTFEGNYIDGDTRKIKNYDALKRRIVGLSSYFKSAQENLLPRFTKTLGVDYYIVNIFMSDLQFKFYANARNKERDSEKIKPSKGIEDLYKDTKSTYKIFSRLYCNFAMPGRPIPRSGGGKMEYNETIRKDLIVKGKNYGKLVKEETIDGVVYVSFLNNITIQAQPSLGTNFKPIEEEIEKTEKKQKRIESMVVNDEEGEIENEDFIMMKKKNVINGKDYGKLIREQTVDGIEYVVFSKKDKNKSGPFSKLKPLKEIEEGEEGESNLEEDKENDITNVLKEANKYQDTQDIDDEKEGEVEGDEILDKIGGISYKERIDAALKYIWDNSNEFLTPTALETYSPKFLHILENIKDSKYLGLHLVYSQFRTLEGIGIFSLVLEKNGFTRFKIKKNSSNGWEMDISPENQGKPTYALYTGTESDEEKKIIKHIYNGEWDNIDTSIANNLRRIAHNNNMGEIIKVFMITSSGSEGINLRNTRYVHIMEPYWHPVRTEQVIGRARRICSHTKLPLALQTVEVFVYLMKFTKQQIDSDIELKRKDLSKTEPKVPVSSDQLLFEISEIKANLSKQLTDAIKESSFDCFIYSNGNCVNFGDPKNDKFAYVPDYEKQQNDTTVVTNKKEDEWQGKPISIAGVDYVYRRMARDVLNIYDKASYLKGNPVLIGTYETNEQGERVFRQVV